MTPTVFLVILCLGVASATESPDPTLDAEEQEPKIKNEKLDEEGFRRGMWEEFMKKVELYNKENGQEDKDDFNIEMNVFDHLTDDEFVKIIDKVLYPMLGEKEKTQTQPVGDVPKFEDLAGSSAVTPVQDQVFVTSLVLSYCLRMASAAPPRDPSLDAEWEEWKMNFKKSYSPVVWTEEELDYDIEEYKDLTKDNNLTPKKDQVYTVTFLPSTAH
ncbi:trophoblast-specific protein alpha-like [Peromyscus eremicus]|uniref:trophoblast-specific protein alpha-like n=1 Tax=Peromyscus eremicus TaxID=42410 RepID=UPI0027DCD3E4|nr:trophoblast-specific protein alpha-like [Peromyscus eremicus]